MVVSNILFFHPCGEDFQLEEHIFQMGWFNHQPEKFYIVLSIRYSVYGQSSFVGHSLSCDELHSTVGHHWPDLGEKHASQVIQALNQLDSLFGGHLTS